MKYHILSTKNNKMKTTSSKNNCIVKIKIMNKIHHIKIHKNHVALLYILLFFIFTIKK